jgi:hypothetical protein
MAPFARFVSYKEYGADDRRGERRLQKGDRGDPGSVVTDRKIVKNPIVPRQMNASAQAGFQRFQPPETSLAQRQLRLRAVSIE